MRLAHVVAAGVVAIMVLLLGAFSAPNRSSLPTIATGDTELISAALKEKLSGQQGKVSFVSIEDGGPRFAHLDADQATEYEIGSITKTFTASLLADAIERGEVEAGTTVGEVFSMPGSALEDVRLDELASHRSGLPRLPTGIRFFGRSVLTNFTHGDPYKEGPNKVLQLAAQESLSGRGTVQYSNLGMAVLGLSIAERSGMSYPELVRTRITEPLGMSDTYIPASPSDLRPISDDGDIATGLTANSLEAAPWTMAGYASAGAIRSTPHDMALYASALLNGDVPGSKALVPQFDATEDGAERIGYAWFTQKLEGLMITWHNGGTGGYSSFIGLNLDLKTAIVVLGGTAGSLDEAAIEALVKQARR